MSRPPLTIWEQAQMQGYSRRDFLQFCSWIAAAAGIEASGVPAGGRTRSRRSRGRRSSGSTSRSAPAAASRSSARRTRSCRTSSSTRSRSTTPRRCRPRPGTRPRRRCTTTMEKYKGEYLMLVEGLGPDWPTTASTAASAAARRSTSSRRRPRAPRPIVAWGSCASNGCIQAAKPNPTGATPDPQDHLRQADHQRARAARRSPRSWPATIVHLLAFDRIPQLDGLGRPKAFYSRRVHDTCYRRPNYDAGPVRRVLRRRERAARLLPLQDGLPRPGHLQRLRRHPLERRRELPDPVRATAASAAARRTSGTTARSTSTWRRFPGFGIETTADTVGVAVGAVDGGRHRRARRRDQHPQAAAHQRGDRTASDDAEAADRRRGGK